MDVNPGIASSYIFSLKPGDKVIMSGPFGDFHPHFDSKKEMIWVGGGAGMAPLRAQIMHMTKTLHTTLGEGVSQLPLPSGSRSSRPCSRCSWRKVHSGLRPSGHAEHLSERPRGSRGYRVLHVRSWPNVEGRGIYARLARCRSRVNYVR